MIFVQENDVILNICSIWSKVSTQKKASPAKSSSIFTVRFLFSSVSFSGDKIIDIKTHSTIQQEEARKENVSPLKLIGQKESNVRPINRI